MDMDSKTREWQQDVLNSIDNALNELASATEEMRRARVCIERNVTNTTHDEHLRVWQNVERASRALQNACYDVDRYQTVVEVWKKRGDI